MSWEKIIDKDFEKSPDSVDLDFITGAQFTALDNHFGGILKSMEDIENLQGIRIEFSKLLQAFQSCYMENERKTRKIFELKALSETQVPKAKSSDSMLEETVKNLKDSITKLQKDLDNACEQRRELLEEIEDLKKTVDTQNKLIQVHAESLEELPQIENESPLALTSRSQTRDVKHESKHAEHFSQQESLDTSLEKERNMELTDAKVLKNNLDILVTDLKLTRHKIQELKEEIREKDTIVEGVFGDLSRSEIMLTEAQAKLLEVKKPMEVKINGLEAELKEKSQSLKDVSKQLNKALALNVTLTKDISSKNSTIEDLKRRLKEQGSTRESALRKAQVFEKHLAKSQYYVEDLKREIEIQKSEALTQQTPIGVVQETSHADRETLMEIGSLERTMETLKNHIALRDKKLRETEEECKKVVEILESLRKDMSRANKEKVCLVSEVRDTKKKLKERSGEVKRLKQQLNEDRKEMAETDRKLQIQTKKQQQIEDKKNKLHCMYEHLKTVNEQQGKENEILVKRQQYLVKILKEKDEEIERIITWKRYIS